MTEDKIKDSKDLITEFQNGSALMCSFGKDSMVLLHLIRETLPKLPPIICHRHPWFPFKNKFANKIIESWALVVHDYPPLHCGVKANDERIELVARYPLGSLSIDLPLNTETPIPHRDFVCGLEWLLRLKTRGLEWPWQNVFIGHKSSDVDPYEGAVPLKSDHTQVGSVQLIFPLRDWTDEDVWNYIEEHHVPYDRRRYVDHAEVPDKWQNPDYIHACTACIDPREKRESVYCPKIGEEVPNLGAKVLRLEGLPDYMNRKAA